MSRVVRVEAYWDSADPSSAGWYARTRLASGDEGDDSMKIWSPLAAITDLSRDRADEVRRICADAYPGAKIEVEA